jgi:hypothetical protein
MSFGVEHKLVERERVVGCEYKIKILERYEMTASGVKQHTQQLLSAKKNDSCRLLCCGGNCTQRDCDRVKETMSYLIDSVKTAETMSYTRVFVPSSCVDVIMAHLHAHTARVQNICQARSRYIGL